MVPKKETLFHRNLVRKIWNTWNGEIFYGGDMYKGLRKKNLQRSAHWIHNPDNKLPPPPCRGWVFMPDLVNLVQKRPEKIHPGIGGIFLWTRQIRVFPGHPVYTPANWRHLAVPMIKRKKLTVLDTRLRLHEFQCKKMAF